MASSTHEPRESWETTSVIICGCGPTGAMLSAYLGRMSIPNVVLEKEPDITTDPRGIALDEDGIRLLQGLGIYDKIYTDIGSPMGVFNFVGGTAKCLDTKPFMRMDYGTTEGGTGHVGFICHKQPFLERHLRNAATGTGHADIRCSSTLTSIEEDEEWVYVKYMNERGEERRIRGKFLAGADGKTGFTRKRYLEAKGIQMEKASQTSYEEIWVALNWKITLPTEKTHPDFPLWKLGYTPEDVYNLFFPIEFRFLCNPERPSVCGRFGLQQDRLWRFEYVVQKHEDGMEMATYPKMKEIVFPYITHQGSRYGLPKDVQFPEDCIQVLRCRPFNFIARSCNKWALNRVILLGDSAHVFPPFGGQGIASGFRDASGLAWRLAVACRSSSSPSSSPLAHDSLLRAWYTERKQQLEKSLAATVENGKYVTEGNALKIFVRDWYLWILQLIPSWKHWLEMGQRREGMVQYTYQPGMTVSFLPDMGGGKCFPQVYCSPLRPSSPPKGKGKGKKGEKDVEVHFTDDVIFAPNKKGLFQIVAILDSTSDVADAQASLDTLSPSEFIVPAETTFLVHDPLATASPSLPETTYRIATADEFAADDALCGSRPAPKYYDMYRIQKECSTMGSKKCVFVILRPDRFVYAVCSGVQQLGEALGRVGGVLRGE